VLVTGERWTENLSRHALDFDAPHTKPPPQYAYADQTLYTVALPN
jgi:hypothetical protein